VRRRRSPATAVAQPDGVGHCFEAATHPRASRPFPLPRALGREFVSCLTPRIPAVLSTPQKFRRGPSVRVASYLLPLPLSPKVVLGGAASESIDLFSASV
jgi:hypothetical protein